MTNSRGIWCGSTVTDGELERQRVVLQVVNLAGTGGEFGGPVSVAEAQARELAARKYEVIVTALRRGGRSPFHVSADDNPRWKTFRARQLIPHSGMLGLLSLGLLSSLWCDARRADVVHVHSGRDLVSLSALTIAWMRKVPFVAQTHGMVLPRRHFRARIFDVPFGFLLRRAKVVLYMTEGERQDLANQLGSSANLAFLGNGVKVQPRSSSSSSSRSNGAAQVLFLARLHPVKRVSAFIEMAALLMRRGLDARYVIHGPDQGDLPASLRLIDDLGLSHIVTYGGPLDHDAAIAAIARSTVYVLPSSADWMPMSLIEALAAGVPSVCTDSCGLAEVLRKEEAALVTDGSPQALADAVFHILANREECARLGARARSVASKWFSIDAVADQLERIYADAFIPAQTNATTRSRASSGSKCCRE